MSTAARLFVCSILWLMALPGASAAAPAPDTQPLAQSALLIVHASIHGDWLSLNIQRAANDSAVVTKDVSVSVGGHKVQVTGLGNGIYTIPVRQLGSGKQADLDIIVGHDGIREILSGKLTLAAVSTPSSSILGKHTEMLWWVLNIGVVSAAAVFLSKRKAKPPAAKS